VRLGAGDRALRLRLSTPHARVVKTSYLYDAQNSETVCTRTGPESPVGDSAFLLRRSEIHGDGARNDFEAVVATDFVAGGLSYCGIFARRHNAGFFRDLETQPHRKQDREE
jgi:hypothetical protein